MTSTLDFDALARDLLAVFRRHGLKPDRFDLHVGMAREDFEALAADHPSRHPEMISVDRDGEWSMLIQRRRVREDYPPGAFLTPPPGG